MELNGLSIFKHLPGGKKEEKANCKECGFVTCMAFALKLAQKATSVDTCPYCSIEFKELIKDSFKKQQNEITFGAKNPVKVGDETVMFRHDKTFVNKCRIALILNTDDKDFDSKLDKISQYSVTRIGETFGVNVIYLIDKGNLLEQAKKVDEKEISLIIETDDTKSVVELQKYNPIFKIHNLKKIEDKTINVMITGNSIDEVEKNSKQALGDGFKNLVLNPSIEDKPVPKIIKELTQIRERAILKKDEPFTYPVLTKLKDEKDLCKLTAIASLLVCRYSNIIALETFNEALLTTLFSLIQNIYADPQKPLQVESKVYEINEPDENALVFLTTNFALTYFAVANEIESTNKPSYLIVTPSDGMSVLTAWSAEKLTAQLVQKTIQKSELMDKIKNKSIIIPGVLFHLKEELEEVLPNWKIIVGPNEAFQLPEFLQKNTC